MKVVTMGLEDTFNTSFVADLSYREKQIQQSYRPIIGIHKWFARRPGTLFRSLMLSEYIDESLEESYYKMHKLKGKIIADPFMGGGTPIIEANRLNMGVIGVDINPMAYWIVRQSLAPINLFELKIEANEIIKDVEKRIGHLYKTTCNSCGKKAEVKYFLWTKMSDCKKCGVTNLLFSNYNIAKNSRHTHFVWFCPSCKTTCEILTPPSENNEVLCPNCSNYLPKTRNTSRNHYKCKQCSTSNKINNGLIPLKNYLFAIEYHCKHCKRNHKGRFFKTPDDEDLALYKEAQTLLKEMKKSIIPNDEIPKGDETNRLHKWGFSKYRELFNARQLLTLNTLLLTIKGLLKKEIRNALATIFSDILRYNNMLCRYDTWALKCQDIFSVHGYPTGLIRCENNVLGINSIGSGGFRHFVQKYFKAKNYCYHPFEVKIIRGKKKLIPIPNENIKATFVNDANHVENKKAFLQARDSRELQLEPNTLDGVFTDPPYFDNVQYSELMDFCYIWLRKIINDSDTSFSKRSTKDNNELTVNITLKRDITNFTEGLSCIFTNMAKALKTEAPLVFTYHHNRIEAYVPIAVAILDSGLSCEATLASPAEMSASIHINGTKSSIIDTIFVCRKSTNNINPDFEDFKKTLITDVSAIQKAQIKLSQGDVQCMALGTLTKHVINNLQDKWDFKNAFSSKMEFVKSEMKDLYRKYDVTNIASNCF